MATFQLSTDFLRKLSPSFVDPDAVLQLELFEFWQLPPTQHIEQRLQTLSVLLVFWSPAVEVVGFELQPLQAPAQSSGMGGRHAQAGTRDSGWRDTPGHC